MQKIAISLLAIISTTILVKQQFYDEDVVCQELDNSCYEDYELVEPDTNSEVYEYYFKTPNYYFEYELQEEEASPQDYIEV